MSTLKITFIILGVIFLVISGISFLNFYLFLKRNGNCLVGDLEQDIKKRIRVIEIFAIIASIVFGITLIL